MFIFYLIKIKFLREFLILPKKFNEGLNLIGRVTF